MLHIGVVATLPTSLALAQTSTTKATDDTRTQVQKKADTVDEKAPALPGDNTRPGELPSPPREMNQGTPGAGTSGSSETTSTTTEKKTAKHKHQKKGTPESTGTEGTTATPESSGKEDTTATPEAKPDSNPAPSDSATHRLENKSDQGNKDQLNSDK
jgi:hypothetical protein